MPLYDYECLGCGHMFELRQGFDADPEGICPRCAGVSRRKFHPVPIIYKGSGFYTTDYKGKSYSPVSTEDKDGTKDKDSTDSKEKTESTAEKKKSEDKASAEKLVDKADSAKKAGAL